MLLLEYLQQPLTPPQVVVPRRVGKNMTSKLLSHKDVKSPQIWEEFNYNNIMQEFQGYHLGSHGGNSTIASEREEAIAEHEVNPSRISELDRLACEDVSFESRARNQQLAVVRVHVRE